jgi:hypothetical protein
MMASPEKIPGCQVSFGLATVHAADLLVGRCHETAVRLFVSTHVANSWAADTTTMSAAEIPAASICGLAGSLRHGHRIGRIPEKWPAQRRPSRGPLRGSTSVSVIRPSRCQCPGQVGVRYCAQPFALVMILAVWMAMGSARWSYSLPAESARLAAVEVARTAARRSPGSVVSAGCRVIGRRGGPRDPYFQVRQPAGPRSPAARPG